MLLWLQSETQNESDSTTRTLQGHFPGGRTSGHKSRNSPPGLCGPEGATGGGDGDIKHSAFFHLLHILKWILSII